MIYHQIIDFFSDYGNTHVESYTACDAAWIWAGGQVAIETEEHFIQDVQIVCNHLLFYLH